MTNRNDNYTNDSIHANIYGLASTLLVVTNSTWKSDFVVVYAIPYKDLKSDNNLKSMLLVESAQTTLSRLTKCA